MRKTTEQFIKESIGIHGDKYDYSLVDYKTARTHVTIICPIHGEFKQWPEKHIGLKRGCPKCNSKKASKLITERNKEGKYKKPSLSTGEFIKRSEIIHGKKYGYSKVDYKTSKQKVIIACPTHGDFEQFPFNHMRGNGCPNCRESHGERDTRKVLEKHNIDFIQQYSFSNLKWKKKLLVIDFYLPEYNTCIEYDGEQHFQARGIITEEKYQETHRLDLIKNKYCEDNDIGMIRIPYTEKDIEAYLLKSLGQ